MVRMGIHALTLTRVEIERSHRGHVALRLAVYALAVLRVAKHAWTVCRIAINGSAVNGLAKYADAVGRAGAGSHKSRYVRAVGVSLVRIAHNLYPPVV